MSMSEISRKAEEMPGVNLCWTSIPSRGGVVILLVTSCYSNWDKLWLNWLFDLSADCTLLPLIMFWWLTTVCDAYFLVVGHRKKHWKMVRRFKGLICK